MRVNSSILAALACLAFVGRTSAAATSAHETTAPIGITVGQQGAEYTTKGLAVNGFLYIYVQGGRNGTTNAEGCQGDHIMAYRAQLDANGHPGTFGLAGRISPCFANSPYGTSVISFAPGQAFRATVNGVQTPTYHMLANLASDGTPQFFTHVWHGETTDGIDWTWHTSAGGADENPVLPADRNPVSHWIHLINEGHSFIQATYAGAYIMQPVMLSTMPQTSGAEWWGFVGVNAPNPLFQVAELVVDWSGSTPTVRFCSSLASNGCQSFSTLTNGYLLTSSPPVFSLNLGSVCSGLQPGQQCSAELGTLLFESSNGQNELWADVTVPWSSANVNCSSGTTSQTVLCNNTSGTGCLTAGGTCTMPNGTSNQSPFHWNTSTCKKADGTNGDASTNCLTGCASVLPGFGTSFAWWNVSRFSFSAPSFASNPGGVPRYLPTGYYTGRTFPYRYDATDGTKYLFSSTIDQGVCTKWLGGVFYTTYVVQTQIAYQ